MVSRLAFFGAMLACALITLSVTGSAAASAASWNTRTPAASFTYAGHPIDPRCAVFDPSQNMAAAFDLRRCARQMRAAPPPDRSDTGSVSAEFPPTADGSAPGYAQYEVIAANGRQFLLSTAINTGGTGIFTAVLLARKEGQRLSVRRLTQAGDRCNGGLASAEMAGNLLRYSLQITPLDVVTLATIPSHDVETGLEASAISCVATTDWEYDMATGKKRLVALTLTGAPDSNAAEPSLHLIDRQGWTEQFAYQHCFNTVYNRFVDAGRTSFAAAEANQFAQSFTARCVSPKAKP